jgi:hypothetical protein
MEQHRSPAAEREGLLLLPVRYSNPPDQPPCAAGVTFPRGIGDRGPRPSYGMYSRTSIATTCAAPAAMYRPVLFL